MAHNGILSEGIALYNAKNYSGALAFFLSLPEDCDCDAVDLAYFIGLCYSKLKRYSDAIIYLEQVVTSDDVDESDRVLQCRYLLAVLYCQSGLMKMADFELNKLLDLGYRPASIYSSLAYIAWEQDDVNKCIEFYEKALIEDPSNPTALNGMGYVLANEERDMVRALSLCKKALAMAPESAACLDSMGWVYFKMGLYSEARKYLEKAKSKDSSNSVIDEHYRLSLKASD